MNLRILHLYEPTPESPFLSTQAAVNHWLPTALRELGHDVVSRPLPGTPTDSLAELSRHFDAVHVFGEVPEGSKSAAPTVQTCWRPRAAAFPQVALSWRQAQSLPNSPVAVIPPAVPFDEVEVAPEHADHLVTVLPPGDATAFAEACRVACSSEMELVVLGNQHAIDVPHHPLVRYVPVRHDLAPAELLSSAAYLSFSRGVADTAAVTAMCAGVPVITLEGLAAAETIISGESGYVCANSEDAARAVGRLDLLSGKLARARARALFDVGPWAERFAEVYAAMAAGEVRQFRHPERAAAL